MAIEIKEQLIAKDGLVDKLNELFISTSEYTEQHMDFSPLLLFVNDCFSLSFDICSLSSIRYRYMKKIFFNLVDCLHPPIMFQNRVRFNFEKMGE